MICRMSGFIVLMVLLSAIGAPWAEESSTPQKVDLDLLVAQFKSETFADRQKAYAALAEYVDRRGLAAEAELRPLRDGADAEGRAALDKELARIGQMKEDAGIFEWYGKAGFPDGNGKLYGRIASGWWSQDGKKHVEYAYGFLMDDGADAVRLISGWREVTIPKQKGELGKEDKDEPEAMRKGFERLELAAQIREACAKLTEEDASAFEPFRGMQTVASSRMDLFFMARNAAAIGLYGESRKLMALAGKAASNRGQEAGGDLLTGLKADMAHALTWETVLECDEPTPTRPYLLERFRLILKAFPGSEHEAKVKEMADQLDKMIEEDKAHAAKPAKKWEEMTKEEKIAELIYQLRDQDGAQFSQPGSCDIFCDWGDEKKKSPASELVAIGFDAVPALIAILDDRRLTRSVGYHRNFYFSHYVLRYGDAAVQILGRITGQSFFTEHSTFSYMTKDGDVSPARKAAEEWWAGVQKKGIEAVWEESILKADRDGASAAERLAAKDAARALKAIVIAAPKTEDDYVQGSLIETAAKMEGDAPLPFLLSMAKSAMPYGRFEAAKSLQKRGKPEGLEAALQILEVSKASELDSHWLFPELIKFVLTHGDKAARQRVFGRYPTLSIDLRMEFIDAVGSASVPEAKEELEAFLVRAIDDDDRRMGMSGSRGDVSYSDPRLGDVAAYNLAELWDWKAKFPFEGSKLDRQRYIVRLKNEWRKKHGQEALPLPEPVKIAPVDPAKAKQLAENLRLAHSMPEADAALKAYVDLGLPGLAPLREALSRLPKDHYAQHHGSATLARIASIVRVAAIAEGSQPLPAEVAKQWGTFEGKPLEATKLCGWIRTFMKEHKGAFELELERDAEGTGVTMNVKAAKQNGPAGGVFENEKPSAGADVSANFRSGGESLGGYSGGGSLSHYRGDKWNEDEEKLRAIFEAPPEKAGSASISVRWSE